MNYGYYVLFILNNFSKFVYITVGFFPRTNNLFVG